MNDIFLFIAFIALVTTLLMLWVMHGVPSIYRLFGEFPAWIAFAFGFLIIATASSWFFQKVILHVLT